MNREKIFLTIIGIFMFLVIVIGTSYAFFTAELKGNSNEMVITSGIMSLEFTDSNSISLIENAIPGDKVTKEFSVRNTGNVATKYDLYFSEIFNDFVDKSDLVYRLESENGGYNTENDVECPSMVGEKSKIVSNYEIGVGEEHNYKLTIEFLNKNEIQDDNKGKKFSAKIDVNKYRKVDPIMAADGVDITSSYTDKTNLQDVIDELADLIN